MSAKIGSKSSPSIFVKINNEIIRYLIAGVLALVTNYVNQSLSWNFENLLSAVICFSAFTLFLGVLFVQSIKWIRKNIPEKAFSNKKQSNFGDVFKRIPRKIVFPIVLSVFILFLITVSLFSFSNYYEFKMMTQNRRNTALNDDSEPIRKMNPLGPKWAMLNTLTSNTVDDETLVFANNLNMTLRNEIELRKLPIELIHENEKSALIDSLIKKYQGLYIIRGTYFKREAELQVENLFLENKIRLLLASLEIESDSLLQKIDSKPRRVPPHNITYDNENPIIDAYNLKVGVPNEIKFFVLSTIGDFIYSNLVTKKLKLSEINSNRDDIIKYCLGILLLAEKNVSYEVNYFGFSPKIRTNININRVYQNIASLLNLRAMDLLKSITDEKSKWILNECLSILNMSNEYIAKLPEDLDEATEYAFLESILMRLTVWENRSTWTLLRLNKMHSEVKQHRQEANTFYAEQNAKDGLKIFLKIDKRRLFKKAIDNWLFVHKSWKSECKVLTKNINSNYDSMNKFMKKASKSRYKELWPLLSTQSDKALVNYKEIIRQMAQLVKEIESSINQLKYYKDSLR